MEPTKIIKNPEPQKNVDNKILTENIFITLDGETFEILYEKLVGIGGESQVYEARRESDQKVVLAKIYTNFAYNDRSIADRNEVLKLLKESDYTETHLLPIYAAGNVVFSDDVKRPIDIIPRGTLVNEANYEDLKNKVIPGILRAINCMHKHGLVHRDIKPENIYLYENEIVIGDFGTSGIIIDGLQTGYTQRFRGTLGYSAPEVSLGYFLPASDYFSLGCTIATLFNGGRHVYCRFLENGQIGELNQAIKTGGLPLPENAPSSLQVLVDALTLHEGKDRADFDAVNLWLKDEDEFVSKWGNYRQQCSQIEYQFNHSIYRTKEELTNAFVSEWETAKGHFYRGSNTTNNILLNFLVRSNQSCADDVAQILEEYDRNKTGTFDHDLGFAKFLHFFNADEANGNRCPIYWCGYTFDSLDEVALKMSKNLNDETVFKRLLQSRFLSWKLSNTEGADEKLIDAIKEIEELSFKYSVFAVYFFMYCLAPNKTFQAENPDDIFAKITSSINTVFSSRKNIEKHLYNDNYLAKLAAMGYKEQVLDFKRCLSEDNVFNMNCFYKLFESICTNKKLVRECFYKYGPYSHLFWVQEHLEIYSFNTESAQKLEQSIKNIERIDNPGQLSIDEIIKKSYTLNTYVQNLQGDFQNEIVMDLMGIDDIKDITANSIDAYLLKDAFDNNVPIGFLKEIDAFENINEGDEKNIEYDENYNNGNNGNTAFSKAIIRKVSNAPSYILVINKISGNRDEIIQIIKYYTRRDAESITSSLSHIPCNMRCNLDEPHMEEFINTLREAGNEASFMPVE